MDELIKALQLLKKYENPPYPTSCSHETLYVNVDPSNFTDEELKQLDEWGFFPDEEFGDKFASYRYGSW